MPYYMGNSAEEQLGRNNPMGIPEWFHHTLCIYCGWQGFGYSAVELLGIVAVDNGIRTIAFPSIPTGVYGYAVDEAALVAFSKLFGVKNFFS